LLLDEAAPVLGLDALDLPDAERDHGGHEAIARGALELGELPLVRAGEQPEPGAPAGVREARLEAVPADERRPARLPPPAPRELVEVELPLDPGPAGVDRAVHREGVHGAVRRLPDLHQGEEAVALEDLAPVDPALAELVRPRVEQLLPASGEQRLGLAAAP